MFIQGLQFGILLPRMSSSRCYVYDDQTFPLVIREVDDVAFRVLRGAVVKSFEAFRGRRGRTHQYKIYVRKGKYRERERERKREREVKGEDQVLQRIRSSRIFMYAIIQ